MFQLAILARQLYIGYIQLSNSLYQHKTKLLKPVTSRLSAYIKRKPKEKHTKSYS